MAKKNKKTSKKLRHRRHAIRRTGRFKNKRLKRNTVVHSTLKKHWEPTRKKKELKWQTIFTATATINTVNRTNLTDRYTFYTLDPSQFTVNQAVGGIANRLGDTIRTVSLDLMFELVPTDFGLAYNALYYGTPIPVVDQLRSVRIMVIEGKTESDTLAECLNEIAPNAQLNGKVNIRYGNVLYDKYYNYSMGFIYAAPASVGAAAGNFYPVNIGAGMKRKRVSIRIPYKAIVAFDQNSRGIAKKPMWLVLFTDQSFAGYTYNPAGNHTATVNQMLRLWYYDME